MAGPHSVVFGGSRGIGRVVVRAFANAGYQVAVLSRVNFAAQSEVAPVLHEATRGPFDCEEKIFAPLAPPEHDADAARAYMEELTDRVDRYRGARDP